MSGLYARALRCGIQPRDFWQCTLAEVVLMLKAHTDADKLHWQRTAHQMALLYNVNRGKGKPLEWTSFYPYERERTRPLKVIDPRQGIPRIFERMQTSMNHGK